MQPVEQKLHTQAVQQQMHLQPIQQQNSIFPPTTLLLSSFDLGTIAINQSISLPSSAPSTTTVQSASLPSHTALSSSIDCAPIIESASSRKRKRADDQILEINTNAQKQFNALEDLDKWLAHCLM